MDEAEEDIKKKCESIDKAKEDFNNIERFEEIYSNFKIQNMPQNYPKIIRDSEPSSIILNEEHDFNEDQNYYNDKNLTYFISENSLFALSKNIEIDNSKNNNDKFAKSYIDLNKEILKYINLCLVLEFIMIILIRNILSKKALEMEIRKSLENKKELNNFINDKERKRKKIHDILEIIKKNKQNKKRASEKSYISKIYNVKYNNNKKDYEKMKKRSMKDIYQHLFGINDDISLSLTKKNEVKNTFQRLYNQGFYTKNKSQINILDNIHKIKNESKRENISKNSKKILGLSKAKNAHNKNKKYDKNNIFKKIKTNMENSYIKFQFHPNISETSKQIVKNMEKSFTRITRPKTQTKIEYNKKKISKEKYQEILNRINFLYLEGVEKIKNKKKLKSCPPSNDNTLESNKIIPIESINNSLNIIKKHKSSRNLYNNQIQWKKRILLENEKKKKIKEKEENFGCTFKPKIITKSIKYLFQKTAEEKIKAKNKRSKVNNSMKSLKNINISKTRYFIINNDYSDRHKMKINKMSVKIKYKEKHLEYSLIQRKSYHLEKFFS